MKKIVTFFHVIFLGIFIFFVSDLYDLNPSEMQKITSDGIFINLSDVKIFPKIKFSIKPKCKIYFKFVTSSAHYKTEKIDVTFYDSNYSIGYMNELLFDLNLS
jgi:hypothetical protein